MSLKDKVVVITGGSGVLCSEVALQLGRLGAKIALMDINEDGLASLLVQMKNVHIDAMACSCNVLDKEDILLATNKVVDHFGHVDVLINGAGGNKKEASTSDAMSFFDIPKDAMEWVFNLNFMGTFLPSQVIGKLFSERGGGNIINISSMNAFTPLTRIPAYSAAKSAVSNFTQWLAVHMAQEYTPKIRVNAIAPGFLLTEQNRFLLTDESGGLTKRGHQIIEHTPAGRFGNPEDIVSTVKWLLDPDSEFITGIIVPIDGGFSAFSGV